MCGQPQPLRADTTALKSPRHSTQRHYTPTPNPQVTTVSHDAAGDGRADPAAVCRPRDEPVATKLRCVTWSGGSGRPVAAPRPADVVAQSKSPRSLSAAAHSTPPHTGNSGLEQTPAVESANHAGMRAGPVAPSCLALQLPPNTPNAARRAPAATWPS
jgi:hypothetical protein